MGVAYIQYFRYFCNMIELARHIEALLLENDCVIVPELGGFVTHYIPAMRIEEENVFLPPSRIIAFNPRLKINDGLLVQSYMTVYSTSFSDATKIVDKEVNGLLAVLHEEGKVDLPNVGELRCSIHDTYDFIPYDDKITTPCLYGLDSFKMRELSAMARLAGRKVVPFVPAVAEKKKYKFEVKAYRSYLTAAVAMTAVVVLFFFLSTPIENTEVVEGNYAQLLSGELFGKIEKRSLAITPIIVRRTKEEAEIEEQFKKRTAVPAATREMKVAQPNVTIVAPNPRPENAAETIHNAAAQKAGAVPAVPSKSYHIIIASVGTEKDAEAMAEQLLERGFPDARAIIGDGKMRVSIESCRTESEAYQALNKIRQNETYQNAWVLNK